jgi:FkbM family methyltransferase
MLPTLLPDTGFNQLVIGKHGAVVFNKNDIVVGLSVSHYGEYFESEVEIFRQIIRPGWHVADAGANIGAHTLALARLVGDSGWVYAFEPQRVVFQTLCANMAVNSISNVDCERLALGRHAGEIPVEELEPRHANNFGGLVLGKSIAGRTIRMTTLDDYLGGRPLHFLKADIQGMEEDCLQGARETFRRCGTVLYVENDDAAKSESLIEHLRSAEYDLYWHMPLFFNPENFAGETRKLHNVGFIDRPGEFFGTIGFAINLLCVPRKLQAPVSGLIPVEDSREHPTRKGTSRFHSLESTM